MMDREKVIDAFRNCITEPKCKDCPWESCETYHQVFAIPKDLALEVMKMLVVQVPVEPVFERQFMTSIEIYDCGKCGTSLGAKGIAKYCMKCGQAVKWE